MAFLPDTFWSQGISGLGECMFGTYMTSRRLISHSIAKKVPMSLQRPHITEKAELVLPITFPLKAEYERLNGTLEGMNTIADRERRPDVDDMIDDVEPDGDESDYEPDDPRDEDQDDDDDEGPHGPGRKASGSKT